jgi:predicted metal-dependent phosphoesterase TrpH
MARRSVASVLGGRVQLKVEGAGSMTTRHQPRAEAEPQLPGAAVADVHTHTTRSDGVLEPAELVRQAGEAGVRVFAVADHDNLAAYRELTASGAGPLPPGLRLVPAVEINAVTRGLGLDLPEGELHVLGIGVDPDDATFEALLAGQRAARRTRFFATVDRLREIGLPVDAQVEALDLSRDDALGRPTLARALVAAGRAETVEDAFERFIGHGRPGYVPRTGVSPVEAIRAIRAAGGLASLAHFHEAAQWRPLLRTLVGEGLNGLESHHRSFDAETRASVGEVARELGLVETGGTDYHGDLGPYAGAHAELVLPDSVADALRAAISRTRCPGRP